MEHFAGDNENVNTFGGTNGIDNPSPSKMKIDELENLFGSLHGPEYFLKDELQPEQFLHIQNMSDRKNKQNELINARINMNSHDFKFSMMPFSEFNNSIDVNLYSQTSKIPFLYKD